MSVVRVGSEGPLGARTWSRRGLDVPDVGIKRQIIPTPTENRRLFGCIRTGGCREAAKDVGTGYVGRLPDGGAFHGEPLGIVEEY